jgi:hypothetical protein
MTNRDDLIVQYFEYLVNEYGFRITRKERDPRPSWNAVVVFESSKIGVQVAVEMDEVAIHMGDCSDLVYDWFSFSNIMKYYAPHIKEVYVPTRKTTETTWDDVVETQLVRLSGLLREYCEPLLKGENLAKGEIKKIIGEGRISKWFRT